MVHSLCQDVAKYQIAPFLSLEDGKALMKTDRFFQRTMKNHVTKLAKEKIERIYPGKIASLLKNTPFPLHRLPILKLETGYIDSINFFHMRYPVMRFVDMLNSPGIAIRIKKRSDHKKTEKIPKTLGVLIFHNTYHSNWRREWAQFDYTIEVTYTKIHREKVGHNRFLCCADCPFSGLDSDQKRTAGILDSLIICLLRGKDPHFEVETQKFH